MGYYLQWIGAFIHFPKSGLIVFIGFSIMSLILSH